MLRLTLLSVSTLLVSILLHLPSLQAQEKVSALGTHDFYPYFEYDELTAFLTGISEAYPELARLESMAESQMGRQVWMLTINNPETGKAEDKPGIFINQIHAGHPGSERGRQSGDPVRRGEGQNRSDQRQLRE